MTKNLTYYGFEYDKTTEVMLNHIPAILREIERMTDGLMSAHDEIFIGDDESPTGQGYFEDEQRHYDATMEITRLLISWMFKCLPPIYQEAKGELFILPTELTIEHAKEHFADLAQSGYDTRERLMDSLWAKYGHLEAPDAWEAVKAELNAGKENA